MQCSRQRAWWGATSVLALGLAGCVSSAKAQPAVTAEPAVKPAAVAPATQPATTPPAATAAAAEGAALAAAGNGEMSPERKEAQQLAAEAALRAQKLAAELAALKEENERLRTQYELAVQKQKNDMLNLQLERDRLQTAAALDQTKRDVDTTPVKRQAEDLMTQQQLRDLQLAADLSAAKAEMQRLDTQRQLDDAKSKTAIAALERQRAELAAQNALTMEQQRGQEMDLEAQSRRMKNDLMNAQARIQIRDMHDQYDSYVKSDIQYRKEPFENGVLYISDRRIDMDGPIIPGTADYVTERISYFNNQSGEYPIFVVINNSPGGMVLEGYRIVKAIQASKAPVYVVVKSFAASMAATIATLAPHSFAYPNAVILHHQMSMGAFGNMSMLEEEIDRAKEWQRRLAEPVAKKMGLTLDEFVAQMYQHAKATGDWEEFADQAVKLKWIDQIVQEIREEGYRKKPVGEAPQPWYMLMMTTDSQGRTYCKLPPLMPGDAYFLYNPRDFYRW